jgi:hypothetical protein
LRGHCRRFATELVALYSAGNWAQLVTAATRSAALVVGELLKAQKFSLQANNRPMIVAIIPAGTRSSAVSTRALRWRLAGAGGSFDAKKRDWLDFKKRRSEWHPHDKAG